MRTGRMAGAGVVVLILWGGGAFAEGGWSEVVSGPIIVKSRPMPGAGVKEIWAEGDLDAPVQVLQDTLLDVARFPGFMPYVKEARQLSAPGPDGSVYVYTRLQLPFVQGRDYVLHVFVDRRVEPDGTGSFQNHWVSDPDRLPRRPNLIRLKTNQGSWRIEPRPDGRSHATYRFLVDPGGWLPAFAVDAGARTAVLDTFRAVEQEARRRAQDRERPRGMPVQARTAPAGR